MGLCKPIDDRIVAELWRATGPDGSDRTAGQEAHQRFDRVGHHPRDAIPLVYPQGAHAPGQLIDPLGQLVPGESLCLQRLVECDQRRGRGGFERGGI